LNISEYFQETLAFNAGEKDLLLFIGLHW